MLIGETFIGGDGDTFFTPLMPRQGNGVTTTFEVVALAATAKVTVKLFEKNSESTGEGSENTSGSGNRTSPGVTSFRNTAIMELVRYQITIEAASEPVLGDIYWAHFRILAPAWETSGAQSI